MKFTLLVVGRTVEKHYITAINDYGTYQALHFFRYGSHPRTQEHQNLSMEQQKRRKEN